MAEMMRALKLDASWSPKATHTVTDFEKDSGKALNANTIWRGPRLQLEEERLPEIAEDEVLVKVQRCGVCGSDTHCYETDKDGYIIFSGPVKLPVTLGHEYTGEVVEVGKGVKTLKVGDPVAPEGMLWCGLCPTCRTGNPNQCPDLEMVGFSSPGAFADYIAVKEKYCWNLSELYDVCSTPGEVYELGALIEPIGCAYNGMFISAGGFKPGAFVAIYGAGPIGLGAVLMARAAGAAKIMVFETNQARCDLAVAMGADFAARPQDLTDQGTRAAEVVMELTRGQGADMSVEAAGAARQTVPEIERSYAQTGKMVYLGRAGNSVEMYLDTLVTKANKIVGARGHAGYGIYPNIIRLLGAGRIPAARMITSHFVFEEVLGAVKQSSSRTDGKIMVTFD